MNRRDFVSRVALGGAAAACTSFGGPAHAAPASGAFKFRFIGLMAFVERDDRSFLVATPGQSHHHMTHIAVPDGAHRTRRFAKAFDMKSGAAAWFRRRSTPSSMARVRRDFVYRSLDNTSIEVRLGCQRPRGERSRRRWRTCTASRRASACAATSRNGRCPRSRCVAASSKTLRPTRTPASCGRSGNHRQQLTDAVNYRNPPRRDDDPPDERHRSADPHDRRRSGCGAVDDQLGGLDARMNNPTKLRAQRAAVRVPRRCQRRSSLNARKRHRTRGACRPNFRSLSQRAPAPGIIASDRTMPPLQTSASSLTSCSVVA